MIAGRPRTAPSPRIRYTVGLQEAVVEHVLRARVEQGDHSAFEQFRRSADRLYIQYVEPEARRQGFRRLYARVFDDLGCEQPVRAAVNTLPAGVDEVVVSRAWSGGEEGAELSKDRRSVGLRLRPARFVSPQDLERFLRHEYVRVADMLDETFGYGDEPPITDAATRLRGERFGLFWDCSIDGRTARSDGQPLRTQVEYEDACVRIFPGLPGDAPRAAITRLWHGERPTYPVLVRLAGDRAALAAWLGLHLADQEDPGPKPGVRCPLCGFPTYAWASSIEPHVAQLIETDFPAWRRHQGACARCVEGYALQQLSR